MQPPNDALLSSAMDLLDGPDLVQHLYLRDSGIPLAVMARLLSHPNPDVRAAAAVGEWEREPSRTIRHELEAQWRVAIREVDPNHYALQDIFDRNPALGFEWLQSQLRFGRRDLFSHDPGLEAAAGVLDRDQRGELLRLFTSENYTDDCFDLILGEHTDLFREWLEYQTDQHLRLRPMERDMGPRWERMALLALDAGASPEDLADHCLPNCWGGVGPLSQHFIERIPAYEALANHPDPRLRPAGNRGLSYVKGNAERELEQERREETYYD